MKLRAGFVSNSSSCSFCVYGFHNDEYDEQEYNSVIKNIMAAAKEIGLEVDHFCGQSDSYFGVGTYDDDIDHYMENWEDFTSEGPTTEEVKKFTEIVQKIAPDKTLDYHSETWRNG